MFVDKFQLAVDPEYLDWFETCGITTPRCWFDESDESEREESGEEEQEEEREEEQEFRTPTRTRDSPELTGQKQSYECESPEEFMFDNTKRRLDFGVSAIADFSKDDDCGCPIPSSISKRQREIPEDFGHVKRRLDFSGICLSSPSQGALVFAEYATTMDCDYATTVSPFSPFGLQ